MCVVAVECFVGVSTCLQYFQDKWKKVVYVDIFDAVMKICNCSSAYVCVFVCVWAGECV